MKEYDVIIIGGGPAGLTAGIYGQRYGLKTLIVENYYLGGQMMLTSEIKNFPSYDFVTGLELTEKMKRQYLSYNGEILLKSIDKIDFDNNSIDIKGEEIGYKALILAMGASARKLELENEKELTGRGVSYCAVCDGYFFKDKDVVVAGSGDSALEDACYLSNLANSVTVVSKHENFTGQDIFIQELKKKDNVKYYMGYQPSKIIGTESLEAVEISSRTNGKPETLKADGLFIQIGRMPDTSLVQSAVDCTPYGYVKADGDLRTNIKNVFVAGDVREKKLRQIITACSDGAIAVNSAFKYIKSL